MFWLPTEVSQSTSLSLRSVTLQSRVFTSRLTTDIPLAIRCRRALFYRIFNSVHHKPFVALFERFRVRRKLGNLYPLLHEVTTACRRDGTGETLSDSLAYLSEHFNFYKKWCGLCGFPLIPVVTLWPQPRIRSIHICQCYLFIVQDPYKFSAEVVWLSINRNMFTSVTF